MPDQIMSPNSSLPIVVVLQVHTLAMAYGDQIYFPLFRFGVGHVTSFGQLDMSRQRLEMCMDDWVCPFGFLQSVAWNSLSSNEAESLRSQPIYTQCLEPCPVMSNPNQMKPSWSTGT